jgi:ABC-type phosphate/phosphonate transport system ATPase subunit
MAGGRVVFDGAPAALTEAAANELYGMAEADSGRGTARASPSESPAGAFVHP